MKHVTYFVFAREAGKVKIGQCREKNPPTNRLKALQTGCPEYLEVLLILPHTPPFEEAQLHRRFSQYRTQGEWFEYRGELKSFVESKIHNPAPTEEDDLRSINGCIPAIRVEDTPVFGSVRDMDRYELYVRYCMSVECPPAPYEKWLKLSDNPLEYEKITDFVEKKRSKVSHVAEPYTRWESPC